MENDKINVGHASGKGSELEEIQYPPRPNITLSQFLENTNIKEIVTRHFQTTLKSEQRARKEISRIEYYVEKVYIKYMSKPHYRLDPLFENFQIDPKVWNAQKQNNETDTSVQGSTIVEIQYPPRLDMTRRQFAKHTNIAEIVTKLLQETNTKPDKDQMDAEVAWIYKEYMKNPNYRRNPMFENLKIAPKPWRTAHKRPVLSSKDNDDGLPINNNDQTDKNELPRPSSLPEKDKEKSLGNLNSATNETSLTHTSSRSRSWNRPCPLSKKRRVRFVSPQNNPSSPINCSDKRNYDIASTSRVSACDLLTETYRSKRQKSHSEVVQPVAVATKMKEFIERKCWNMYPNEDKEFIAEVSNEYIEITLKDIRTNARVAENYQVDSNGGTAESAEPKSNNLTNYKDVSHCGSISSEVLNGTVTPDIFPSSGERCSASYEACYNIEFVEVPNDISINSQNIVRETRDPLAFNTKSEITGEYQNVVTNTNTSESDKTDVKNFGCLTSTNDSLAPEIKEEKNVSLDDGSASLNCLRNADIMCAINSDNVNTENCITQIFNNSDYQVYLSRLKSDKTNQNMIENESLSIVNGQGRDIEMFMSNNANDNISLKERPVESVPQKNTNQTGPLSEAVILWTAEIKEIPENTTENETPSGNNKVKPEPQYSQYLNEVEYIPNEPERTIDLNESPIPNVSNLLQKMMDQLPSEGFQMGQPPRVIDSLPQSTDVPGTGMKEKNDVINKKSTLSGQISTTKVVRQTKHNFRPLEIVSEAKISNPIIHISTPMSQENDSLVPENLMNNASQDKATLR